MAVHGPDPWTGLKILVSAVQSRLCPPFFQPFSERPRRAVTELSPRLSLSEGDAAAVRKATASFVPASRRS